MNGDCTNNNEVAIFIDGDEKREISPDVALATAREAFNSGKTYPISFRRSQLQSMYKMLIENKEKIYKALYLDLRKSRTESELSEIEVLRVEIGDMLRNLKNYSKKNHIPLNTGVPFDTGFTKNEPFGVVLVLGAWNFPFMTTLQPVIGAIAAGNCVIIKPSELASKSSRVMLELTRKYLDKSCYHVIEADLEGTKALLKNKFDYIFATGSCAVGKAIQTAAAVHLTPTTLELGGKSPVYIDDSCLSNINVVAKRLLWGKLYNLGQICVGPDYILCSKPIEEAFLREAKIMLRKWYGDNIQESRHLSRIINEHHFNRLKGLLETTKGKLVLGGQMDEAEKWISPTILVDVSMDDSLMKDEIFGPILPIVTVSDSEMAIELINSRPKPLALYVFCTKKTIIKSFINKTSSGSICVNDVNLQVVRENLPFGGVGDSGMGQYHGKYTFETFSHKKAILWRPISVLDETLVPFNMRYPPYNSRLMNNSIKYGVRYFHLLNINLKSIFMYLLLIGLGALVMFALFYFNVIQARYQIN